MEKHGNGDQTTEIVQVHAETGVLRLRDAAVDMQVATAHAYPRSVTKAIRAATDLATISQEMAESCIYALPRSGKTIDGPSVRLAEIVGSAWGNMRIEAGPVQSDDPKYVESEATAWDLESNLAVRVRTKRRCTDRQGNRYNDDMISVTSNAATSIAMRNAIFRVVPKSVVETVYRQARKAAIGDQQTLAARRARAIETFGKMGVSGARVLQRLGRVGVDDITSDDLAVLIGVLNAIRDGDSSQDDEFPAVLPEDKQQGQSANSRVEEAKRVLGAQEVPGKVVVVDKTTGEMFEGKAGSNRRK